MWKAAVIGNSESIKGFAALGLKVFETDEPQQALRTISVLAEQQYGVIYLTEALYSVIEPRLERYRYHPIICLQKSGPFVLSTNALKGAILP